MWWLHRLLALQILLNALLSNPIHMERTRSRMSYRMCIRYVLWGLSICHNLETTPASTTTSKAMPDTLWWLWATQSTKEELSFNNVFANKLSPSIEMKGYCIRKLEFLQCVPKSRKNVAKGLRKMTWKPASCKVPCSAIPPEWICFMATCAGPNCHGLSSCRPRWF